jgi:hypothetical protein
MNNLGANLFILEYEFVLFINYAETFFSIASLPL